MAGIFDHMNRPGTVENQRTMNAGFVTGVIMRRILGLSNNTQLLSLVNTFLGSSGPLNTQAQNELLAIYNWVNAGATTEAKAARLGLAADIWSIYEQAQSNGTPWLTEAEARTAFTTAGVVFS